MTIAVISMIRDSWGGSEELWYEMAKIALKQNHKIIHVGFETLEKHPKIKELEALGLIRILRPGWIPSNSSTRTKYSYLARNYLRKKLSSPLKKLFTQKPDIVIYNGTCYSIAQERELLNYMQEKKNKFFIIGHLNHDLVRSINNAEAKKVLQAYQLSEKVFFVSKRNLETAKRHLCADILNASIIRNPVNLSSTDLLPFPSTDATIHFACVGNLVIIHKGQDKLIETLSKWNNKNWVLNIYGQGSDKSHLQNLVHYLGLDRQVIFHGSVKNIREEVWKKNHVLFMPSHMEGMPLAVVEAMLCGRVCIATNVGGISEWIVDEKTGFIADAPTIHSLSKALEKAWGLKNKWSQIGADAHKAAMQLYDPNAGANLLNRIIAEENNNN
jgi:glycosyltransferase involved in cell wall biosynthesis